MKIILIIAAAFIGVLVLSGLTLFVLMPRQVKAPRQIETTGNLDAYFEKITGNDMPPAISVSVMKEGEMVYRKAFGQIDSSGSRSAEVDTIFPWWSVTKLFTAVSVLQLMEQGYLNLDDPLEKFLPYYEVTDEKGVPVTITIRQILNHSSGLRDLMPDGLIWIHLADQPPVSQTQFVMDKLTGPYRVLKFDPDTDVYYTNVGYVLLGAVVEKITGQSYESYVNEMILEPLSMYDTTFLRSEAQEEQTAGGSLPVLNIYSALLWKFGDDDFFDKYVDKKVDGRMWLKPLYTDYTPSTGLSGPSKDLATFGQFLMSGTAANGARVLKMSTINEMQKMIPLDELPKRYKNVHHYSFGLKAWVIDGRRVFGHAGGGAGYGALLAFLPDEQLVVTVNANDASLNRNEMLRVLTALDW